MDFLKQFQIDPNPPYLMEWEKTWWGCRNWAGWLSENTTIPYTLAVLYIGMVHVGPMVMTWIYGPDEKKAMSLKGPLAAWNLLLCLFSLYGAIRCVPVLYANLMSGGFFGTICGPAVSWCEGTAGMWTFYFIVSKVPELVDTIFLVLRRKPIEFLHWYHHFTVMLFCWLAGANVIMPGLWFSSMNLCVHSIMYFYYFCMAVDIKAISAISTFITVIQIAQMIMGVIIVSTVAYYQFLTEQGCQGSERDTTIFGLIMYSTYLFLFVQFFLNRYVFGKKDDKKKKKGE